MVQEPMGNCAKRPWSGGPKVGRQRPEIWVAPCIGQIVVGRDLGYWAGLEMGCGLQRRWRGHLYVFLEGDVFLDIPPPQPLSLARSLLQS